MLAAESIVNIKDTCSSDNLPVFNGDTATGSVCFLERFGGRVVFNHDIVRPGSVILTRGSDFSPVPSLQRIKLGKNFHNQWRHVAIMGQDGYVWDIMPRSNVRMTPFAEFLSEVSEFAVRQLRPEFGEIDGDLLTSKLEGLKKTPYKIMTVAELKKHARDYGLPVEIPKSQEEASGLICSTFVFRALLLATNAEVIEQNIPMPFPQHFATSTFYEDVDLKSAFFRFDASGMSDVQSVVGLGTS